MKRWCERLIEIAEDAAASLRRIAVAQETIAKGGGSKPGTPVKLILVATLEGKIFGGGEMVTLTDKQSYGVSVGSEADALGNPLPADAGPFSFKLSDDTLGTLVDGADGKSTQFTPTQTPGHLGAGSIICTDASNSLQGISNFTVIASAPATLILNESAPA